MHPAYTIGAIAILWHLGLTLPAAAAVRTCVAPQTSGVVSGATEPEARRKAMAAWTAKARAIGQGYAAWSLAVNKALKCAPAAAGKSGFVCFALGAPCTIRQAPPPRRPGKGKLQEA
jgi:hypothetical protein